MPRITSLAIAIPLWIAMAACTAKREPMLDVPEQAAPGIRASCSLVERRCSRCHPLDRITHVRITSPLAWQRYVRRMRLIPGSGIPEREEPSLVECLVYRSLGDEGLARLRSQQEDL